MYKGGTRRVLCSIVSILETYVRVMVSRKDQQNVVIGRKAGMSLVGGFAFIDKLGWNAFNKGTKLKHSITQYRKRFGFYPTEVLADKIYCTRQNRKWLKERGVKLAAKPLGRPSARALHNHASPGQGNPIMGKFGQCKMAYGLNLIRAPL